LRAKVRDLFFCPEPSGNRREAEFPPRIENGPQNGRVVGILRPDPTSPSPEGSGAVRHCGMTTARYGAVGFSLAPVMAGT
jgi:hypothetical protein